ncbi:MAG TPA: hypothetical protein VF735_16480 [Pyrinomonadaceae bacterium]
MIALYAITNAGTSRGVAHGFRMFDVAAGASDSLDAGRERRTSFDAPHAREIIRRS